MGAWEEEIATLKANGINDEELAQHEQDTRALLFKNNISGDDIDKYMGVKKYDPKGVTDHFIENSHAYHKANTDESGVHKEKTWGEYFAGAWDAADTGWQNSVSMLLKHAPTTVLPENADMFYRIASQVGTLAGDLPFMMAGGWAGGLALGAAGAAAGSAVGGPVGGTAGLTGGAVIGRGAGAFALPAGMRKWLMDGYEKGTVKDWPEFWERASAAMLEAGKGAIVGGATSGTAGIAEEVLGKSLGSLAWGKMISPMMADGVGKLGVKASEVLAMVGVGAALEGHAPKLTDFTEAALMVGGLSFAPHVGTQLRGLYEKTGFHPRDVLGTAEKRVEFKQKLLEQNPPATTENLAKMMNEEPIVEPNRGDAAIAKDVLETEKKSMGLVTIDGEIASDAKPKEETASAGDGGEPPKEPPKGKAGGASDEDHNALGRMVGEREKLPGESKVTKSWLYTQLVDKLNPIREAMVQLVGGEKNYKKLSTMADPYKLARMVDDANSKVAYFFEKGTLDGITLEHTSDNSLKSILEPHNERQAEFNQHLVARRALEYAKKGAEVPRLPKADGSLYTHEESMEIYKRVEKDGRAEFGESAKKLTEFSNSVLEYVYKSGRLSREQYLKIKADNEFYSPMSRLVEEEAVRNRGKAGSLNAINKGGSDLRILNPVDAITENTKSLLQLSERNKAVRSLVEADPTGRLMREVKTPTVVTSISPEEIQRHLEKNGLKIVSTRGERLDNLWAENRDKIEALKNSDNPIERDLGNIFTEEYFRKKGNLNKITEDLDAFRKKQNYNLNDNEFEVYRDGKRKVYETDVALAQAVKGLDGNGNAQSLLVQIGRPFAQMVKIGTTITPEFVLKNLFRDQITKGSFSEHGNLPFTGIIDAMRSIVKEDDSFWDWKKSGGAGGAFLELNERYLTKNVWGLEEKTGFFRSAFNLVDDIYQDPTRIPEKILNNPLVEKLKFIGALTEQATRLSEFKRIARGESSGDRLLKAGFGAREITVDFQRMGALMSSVNAIVAFSNVQIQGLDRTIRAFSHDFKGTALRTMAGVTIPSLYLWALNHDEEWYKETPQWQKDLFWHFKIGDNIFRLPKPQELGILFGSAPERMLSTFYANDPRGMKKFADTLIGAFSPSMLPTVAVPFIEHLSGRSLFTGRSLIPMAAERATPDEQYSDYTSEFAKTISKGLSNVSKWADLDNPAPGENTAVEPMARAAGLGAKLFSDIGPEHKKMASPAIIDNYIKAWSGQWGIYFLQLTDKLLTGMGVTTDTRPTMALADMPIIKAFTVRYPSTSAQSLQDFRDRVDKTMEVVNSLRLEKKRLDFDAYEKTLLDNPGMEIKLQGTQKAISAWSQEVHLLNAVPIGPGNDGKSITKDDKRALIDNYYMLMIRAAQDGLKTLDQIDEEARKLKYLRRMTP